MLACHAVCRVNEVGVKMFQTAAAQASAQDEAILDATRCNRSTANIGLLAPDLNGSRFFMFSG